MAKRKRPTFTRRDMRNISCLYLDGVSVKEIADKYGTSPKHIYEIFGMAIVSHCVSLEVAKEMRKKSAENAMAHVQEEQKEAVKRHTNKKYDEYLEKRKYFVFSIKEAEEIVNEYANSKDSLEEFAKYNCIPIEFMESTLKSFILRNLPKSTLCNSPPPSFEANEQIKMV